MPFLETDVETLLRVIAKELGVDIIVDTEIKICGTLNSILLVYLLMSKLDKSNCLHREDVPKRPNVNKKSEIKSEVISNASTSGFDYDVDVKPYVSRSGRKVKASSKVKESYLPIPTVDVRDVLQEREYEKQEREYEKQKPVRDLHKKEIEDVFSALGLAKKKTETNDSGIVYFATVG